MNKKSIKKLFDRLLKEYEYVSILATESEGKSYSVSAQGVSAVSDDMYCECGYVVKAWQNGNYAEYSFNEIKEDSFENVKVALDMLFSLYDAKTAGLYELPEEDEIKAINDADDVLNPQSIKDSEYIARLSDIRQLALNGDERIMDCRTGYSYQVYSKYFLSPAREMAQKKAWTSARIVMLAKKGNEVKSYFKSFTATEGEDLFEVLRKNVKEISDCTIELLHSETMVPGEYDCICTPEVTGMIVHEAFGHGVEMDMFVKDRALAKNYIGKQVASELVTMHDGAKAAKEVASFDFDDEGNPGTDTIIIEKGILKNGMNDLMTAQALSLKPTGNGRRESFERKAYTRMTNTFFEGGKDIVEDMIASIKDGFLLDNATCGMEDPKNWGIQCMVNVAREIKDGKLTGRCFSPVVLSGYVPDLLKSISMMSEKVELCGAGFCGKGYKEWVKVSDGGPYIKARIKLG